jgi:predicted Zn-dependent protease
MPAMRRLPLLLPLLALLPTCQTNPTTGRSQLLIFSESHMNQLGVEAYAQMTGPQSEAKISNDPALTAPLLRVGAAISAAADKPDYQWEFKLIDDPKTVNAWALPGGKIAFYTGIYPILQDEEGMAIVMGHEVMHAILKHSNERMSQQALAVGATTAAAVALHDNENRDAYLAALGAGAAVGVILPYSRKHESEADKYGLFLAARAGYDPEAAIGVWERMAALGGGNRPPAFLSTHPDPAERVKKMKEWMPEAKRLYGEAKAKQVNRKLPMPPGTVAPK